MLFANFVNFYLRNNSVSLYNIHRKIPYDLSLNFNMLSPKKNLTKQETLKLPDF